MACEQNIIVGIDFGTTASGIGLLVSPPHGRVSNVSKEIEIFQSWDTSGAYHNPVKFPSILAYSEENPSLPIPPWEISIEAQHDDIVSWFKLLLNEELNIENWVAEIQGWADSRGIFHIPKGMTALQVIVDFLGCLRDALWDRLKVAANAGGNLDTTPIQFWFTVPVCWSDPVRGLMREAISHAGFGTRGGDQVHLLTEAQAAMTFALAKVSSFKSGDGVIICDCGGGTVDLASYLISHDNPLIFDELAHSNGELYGSTLIDRGFYRLMCERFGDAFQSLPRRDVNPFSPFMSTFERIKCKFDQSSGAIHHLPLIMSPLKSLDSRWYDKRRKSVLLSSADLDMLFYPALVGIVNALQRQIEEANNSAREIVINKIVLVGGFSLSPYLYRNLQQLFGNSYVIHRPDEGVMAPALGAVLWGSGAYRPRTRVVRCHYGFQGPIFTDNLLRNGAVLDAAMSSLTSQANRPCWVIKKGERYHANQIHEQSGVLLHRHGETAIKTITICCSERDSPPASVNDPETASIGRLICDISHVHLPSCLHYEMGCRLHYLVEYQIRVQLGECGGLLCFEVICQGKTLGNGEVRVDYFRKGVKN